MAILDISATHIQRGLHEAVILKSLLSGLVLKNYQFVQKMEIEPQTKQTSIWLIVFTKHKQTVFPYAKIMLNSKSKGLLHKWISKQHFEGKHK